MISKAITTLAVAASIIFQQPASAQNSTTACNNSPDLCSRQYNSITYLGAHNSPFLRNSETRFSTSGNQFYNTTQQLSSGVRLVTAQVQTQSNETQLRVCHTDCGLLDAGSLSDWLQEIRTWLDSNPNDVVTVLLVNGASASASDLADAYTSSGLDQYAYTPSTSAATSTWPTLESLISNGTRAMNFIATLDDNSAAPYLMNEFTYIVENDYENTSPTDYTCDVSRPSTLASQTAFAIAQGYMTLVNHFLYEDQFLGIQSPNETYANVTNAPSSVGGVGNLGSAASTCLAEYGKAPTFLLVDFSNMGPAIEVVDELNQVTITTGRLSLPTMALSESSAAAISAVIPRISTVVLGLSVALLAAFFL